MNTFSLEKLTHFQKFENLTASRKSHERTGLIDINTGRRASVPDTGAGVLSSFLCAETHLWFPKSTVRGMDHLCSPQTVGSIWENRERDVSCASGLPQPLFLGLVLRGGWERGRDFALALRNEKWHGSPKRGASSACYGLVKAVILICTPFLHCLIMERRCQGLIGSITWSPVKSR